MLNRLNDPEIATNESHHNAENKWNFCEGNRSMMYFTNFLTNHECEKTSFAQCITEKNLMIFFN